MHAHTLPECIKFCEDNAECMGATWQEVCPCPATLSLGWHTSLSHCRHMPQEYGSPAAQLNLERPSNV